MKYLLLSVFCITALFSNSCRVSDKVSSAEFGKYISGFTSGKVNLDEEIRIELSGDIIDSIPQNKRDSVFLRKHIRISPKVKGRFYWVNYRTVGFKPDNLYSQLKHYHVKFELGDFIKTSRKFQTFEFNFETDRRSLDINEGELKVNNPYELVWQRYELPVHSNTELDTQKLATIFTAKEEERILPLSCTKTAPGYYKIIIDSIQRKNRERTVLINWDAKKLDIDNAGTKKVTIPSLGNFKVINMAVQDNGDQQVNITFSDPIHPNQDFGGLIEIEDAQDLKFNTNGNIVTIFLQERIEGAKHITVNKGVLNYANYKMDSTDRGILNFEGVKPALRMDSKGCILPNSQGLLFPFESIGLHTIDVRIIKIKEKNIHQFLQVNDLDGEDGLSRVGKILTEKTIRIIADTVHPQNQWTTHILDLGKLIKAEPGSLYRICIRFKRNYTYLACRNQQQEEADEDYTYNQEPQDSTWNEYTWHGNGFDGYNTWRWNDDDPCSDSYYYGGAISRNILASDIGVMYQEEKNRECNIVTTNLINAAALSNTEVSLYNFTRDLITSGRTDNDGMLHLHLTEKPFLLVAKKGEQRTYLKLTNAQALSLSKFDIEGQDQQNGTKGFLYAERGVWRPGDSVFLNFVLNDKGNPLPEKHPIKFELINPDGATIISQTVTENTGHLYPLYFKTSANAKTGNYQARVTVGNARFSHNILLEYIVPNRMKLKSNVENQLLSSKDSVIDLKVTWLNGAKGKKLKAQTSVTIKPDPDYFSKYPDYTFIAPYNKDFYGNYELSEATTDDSGTARFLQTQATSAVAPGILDMTYTFKAFEQGGGFSIDKAEAKLSLFDSYAGIQKPKGNSYYGSFDYSKTYAFPYVILDRNQNPVKGHHLHLKIYEMQRSNWYEADENDIATFKSYEGKICVKDTQWVSGTGAGTFAYGNIGKNYGRYMIVLKDLASGHETGMTVTFDNPYWNRYSSEDADYETIVQLSTNKSSYTAGEKITLNIPAPEQANVLVNIESDSKIIRQFWTKGGKSGATAYFTATPEMAPGIYIHATVLQPHHYTKDGSPIRQYGVIPIKITDPDSKLNPAITIKDEIRPEVSNTIKISEQNGREMNYSIVLVDEGLLDLTHYKLPRIWEYMNSRQSLKIKTWDMYNQVIGAYAGKIQNVFTIGGDGSYEETEDTKANRFPPAIINLGVFHLNPGEHKTHSFKVNNYCGSMKAIVVAYAHNRSGSTEKQLFVKKPLMLLTSAPRMMSAKEQYVLPVTIFNMEKKARKVKVTLTATGLAGLNIKSEQLVTFTGEGDAVVNFHLSLPEEKGLLNLDVNAGDGKETALEHLQIQVKPTRPVVNHLKQYTLASNEATGLDISPKGMKGTYTAAINVSDKINFDFQDRLRYLISYPHGCVEQTTSSAFAQLFLNDIEDLSDEEAKAVKTHVELVLKKLQQFQTYNGGFAYWPYQYDVNDYASVYVFHFLIEARDKGFELSDYVWKNALSYQQKCAKEYSNNFTGDSYYYQDKEQTQAYRLYLLSRLNIPDITAMNKLRAGGPESNTAKALLAKAYAQTGKQDIANALLLTLSPQTKQKTGYYGNTFGSDLRDESLTLIALTQLGTKTNCDKIADAIAAQLSNEYWNSTLSTSLALTALSGYYNLDKPSVRKYELNGKQYSFQKHNRNISLNTLKGSNKVNFKNTGTAKLHIQLNEWYSDTDSIQKLINNGMQLKITYTDMKNALLKEDKLTQGSNFIAKITVTNTSATAMSNIALEYGIANGWQILSNRYMDDQTINKNADADYSEAKDDGMYYYFSLSPQETKTYYVLLNASYIGKFYLPMAQCYPMYNESYKAQLAGKWIQVTE